MNSLFWLLIALMLAFALLLLAWPLFKRQGFSDADGKQRNLNIARQQLADLKRQRQEGLLSDEQFDEQYLELQQSFNDDLNSPLGSSRMSNQGRWVILPLVVLIPLFSLSLYAALGDPDAMHKAQIQQTAQQNATNVQAMIQPLIERLKTNPDDIQGWVMLGRSYVYLRQYQNAADVFAQLNRRLPDNLEVMLNYADSLAMSRNGSLAGEPAALIAKVLQLAPDNQEALWMAGLIKVEEGDAAQALAYWQKLAALLPADSESLPQLRQMIAEVSAKLSQGTAAIEIPVHVELEPTLEKQTQAEQTLFIYAQAANGPKMPLAIVRKRVADLPLEVKLSDSMAMQANRRLSDFKQLRIVARISKTGDASQQSGDFIGATELSLPLDAPEKAIKITINQEVK